MNRYPLWKYLIIAFALAVGLLYTLPNFFGEAPAVQVSSVKTAVKVDIKLLGRVEETLKAAGIAHQGSYADQNSVRVRFGDTETQIRAKDVIEKAINPDPENASYVVALNLLSRSPAWLTSMHALPMYLGLDLRGGVHFLLQVDMKGALTKRLDATAADLRSLMRDKGVRHGGIARERDQLAIRFRDAETRNKARAAIEASQPDLQLTEVQDGADLKLTATLKPEAQKRIQEFAIKQNITTLHNRINELGVAEPVIQQQGADRIVVQLPGVQDTAKAKDILGRTASLEVRLVDDENSQNPAVMEEAARGQPPVGTEYYVERSGAPLLVRKQVVLTGDRLTDAQPGFDNQTHEPAVHLTLDSAGARIFKDVTRDNVGKRMAILLIEKGRGEVITAPVIREEIGGGRVQITDSLVYVDDAGRQRMQNGLDTAQPYVENPDYTAIINERHLARLQGYREAAAASGAEIIELNPASEDFSHAAHRKMPPCLVINPADGEPIMRNEIFGPLLPIRTYRDINEAVDFINGQGHPLALYYFGRSGGAELEHVLARTRSGGEDLPFGGVGPSGMGAYHGHDGFKRFSHARAVYVQSKINLADLFGLRPRDGSRYRSVIDNMMK